MCTKLKILLEISYILSFTCFMVLAPILDGFVLKRINKKNYANIRSYGSLGAAISFFLNTFFINSYFVIISIDILGLIIMIIILFTMKDTYETLRINTYLKHSKELLKNKHILIILIIAFLTYGTLKADDPYAVLYNKNIVLIQNFIYAIFGATSMFFESFIMKINNFILKFKKSNLLFIATFTLLIIYFTRFYLYHYKWIILLGNIFIGLFIGIFVPIAIQILNSNVDKNNKTTILSLYQMSITIGGIIIGFITTTFLNITHNLPNIYLLHTIIIAFAIIFIYLFKDDINSTK